MREWIISVVGAVILTTIIGFILPEKQTYKAIKSVCSILLILVIFKPVFKIDFNNINFDNIFSSNEIILQDDFIDYYNEKTNIENQKKCNLITSNFGFEKAETIIEYKTLSNGEYKIEKVKIFLNSLVINENKEHINIIEQLRDGIKNFLFIEKDKVIVYD